MQKLVVAVLETMWDWRSYTSEAGYKQAPRYFTINPNNHSGRRLYKLINGNGHLLVTNACKELVTSAKEHGTPDPIWLADNLKFLDGVGEPDDHPFFKNRRPLIDLLLVCGKVAQKTYADCGFSPRKGQVIEIPHPAGRAVWTKKTIADTQDAIAKVLL